MRSLKDQNCVNYLDSLVSTLAYLDIGAALIGLSAHMGSFSMELKWLKMDGISMYYAEQTTVRY